MPSGYLKDHCYLKRLEEPFIYDAATDELYLLDEEAYSRIQALHGTGAPDPEAAGLLDRAGLLQDSPRSLPPMTAGHSADPSLRYLEVQITGRCDKACRHCYLGAPVDVDMDQGVFSDLVGQFAAMQGLKIMVSGGEPALHPGFREMAELLPKMPLRAVLITHGEWISFEEASWIGSCFHQVQVSLDGGETGHDALRGKGSFRKAAAGIKALSAQGVPVSVGTMVHGQNLEEFRGMDVFLRDLGVQEWSIDVPCPAGRWDSGDLDQDLLREMSERIRFGYGGGYHGGAAGLACGSHLMTVSPDGTAAKCGFYFGDPAGNTAEGLAATWDRIRHIPLDLLDCHCDQIEECAGGCRYRAEILGGSERAIDIVQCYARGMK